MFKFFVHSLPIFSMLICGMLSITQAYAAGTQTVNKQVNYEVLCYHDIKDEVDGGLERETTLLSTKHLASHLTWLHDHGYHPISVDDILSAQQGIKPLPEKPVLLTFDDGYVSFYTHAYPLLKLFNYPAVAALVGSWLDAKPSQMVTYGDAQVPRENFLTPAQIKEIAQSGLVEFSSHSYALHKGILMNPHGSTGPAAITRQYFADAKRYESANEYQVRISEDLKHNSEYIKALTGKAPRIMVWPYGRYNQVTLNIAKSLGMPITFSLDANQETPNNLQNLSELNRALIDANPNEQGLANIFRLRNHDAPQRIVHIDLDMLYDQDPVQMWKNLDVLLDRIKSLAPSAVYLQAYADPDGDGNANALYFENRHLPVRADIFSRIARQLRTRAGVEVYAWMPVLAFDLPNQKLQRDLSVINTKNRPKPNEYRRLSPFSPEARGIIKEIYEDLATHAMFDGLLFHDDATLSNEEDDSSYARNVYYQQWKLPSNALLINQDAKQKQAWASLKSRWLTDFTMELAQVTRQYQPHLKTARNLYASAILNPASEQWLAQNYADFLSHYDYTAVMAMSSMEKASEPDKWLAALVDVAKRTPNGIKKTLFELQATDWNSKKAIDNQTLTKQFEVLLNNDARHIGYYPDNFVRNQPSLEEIRPFMSTRSFPYLPK